jgi:hypothetical protein
MTRPLGRGSIPSDVFALMSKRIVEEAMLNSRESSKANPTGTDDGYTLAMPRDGTAASVSSSTLEARAQDMQLYQKLLIEAGVRTIEFPPLALTGRSKVVPSNVGSYLWRSALEVMAETESPKIRKEVITACMAQAMQVADTIGGARPIGFDARFDHFMVFPNATPSAVFLEPTSPPRLMFSQNASGAIEITRFEDLLLRYPDGVESDEQVVPGPVLREMYYTPVGIAKNVLAWSIAARYARSERREKYSSTLFDGGPECIDACCEAVSHSVRKSLEDAVGESRFGEYINFRMGQAWQRYRNFLDDRHPKVTP